MTEYGLVYITARSTNEAKTLARVCVKNKLAACVNIFPSTVSCYEWEGEYTEEAECVLLMKTKKALFNKLCEEIKKHHSYTLPCLLFVPIDSGNKAFLNWIDRMVSPN